jgi:hypothetical protein
MNKEIVKGFEIKIIPSKNQKKGLAIMYVHPADMPLIHKITSDNEKQ